MDEDRVFGRAKNVGGKIEEGVGRATDDAETTLKGQADQATGAAEEMYGQAADNARQSMATLDSWFRRTIETQPYTTALVALGVGWLFGRLRRPY